MHREQDRITCSIFQQKEPIIKEFTDRLNKVKDYQQRQELASDLSRYVDMLLECLEYNVNSLDCKNCRFISNLRKKTANIIIKAKELV
jgi:uncharacterized protein YeeX (DUF496 family)